MFYTIIIPSLILSLVYLCKFHRIAKHDRVLYPFCDLRRDIMSYFRENINEMSESEIKALKRILDHLNIAIHDYSELKSTMFNLGYVINTAKETKKHVLKYEKVKLPENSKIKDFYRQSNKIMIKAFLSYTPFFRSILLPLGIIILNQAVKKGIAKLQPKIQSLFEYLKFYDEKIGEYDIDVGHKILPNHHKLTYSKAA